MSFGSVRQPETGEPPMPAPAIERERLTLGWVLSLAIATALATGLLQAAVFAWRSNVSGQLIWQGRDYPWMGPAAYVLLFLPVALALFVALSVAGRLGWNRGVRRVVAAVFVFLGVFGLLLLWPRLQPLAKGVLALGLAVQGSRLLATRSSRTLGRAALGLAVAVVVIGVAGRLARALGERRSLAAAPPASADSPNVLLIILDTVRAASLSLYGYGRETTPALARWAAEGVVFDRAISAAPWTLPSHSAMFTGRNASELTVHWRAPLDETLPTLAERFRDFGYATAGFVANTYYAGHDSGLDERRANDRGQQPLQC